MDQLVQNLKDGEMKILEVPFPGLLDRHVLVRNYFSVISAGTEGKTVKDARAGYLEKARSRKEEVKKIINTAKKTGILKTYQMVMNRLESPVPLGYCCAGVVIETGSGVHNFKAGDRVACGGNTANHAEIISVPENLCVKIADGVDLSHAAFTTLGAIALQGIRQADLRLGESCAVIGVGLVGQLTMQMLLAAGIKAVGVDIDPIQIAQAKNAGINDVINRDNEFLEHVVKNISGGYGVDAVIITAATSSNDPVDLAGELCRHKGKVVIVGSVPTGFKRASYFKKELELRMSTSYGPGRYDPQYEEAGHDYPYGYVRWTENRNMMAFADMLSSGSIQIEKLISHRFKFHDAKKAYDLVVQKSEPFTGIILEYATNSLHQRKLTLRPERKSELPVAGFIGAGSFAQNILLPAVKDHARMHTLVTGKAVNARHLADKYSFENCSGNADDIFNDNTINTVFVTTRHDSHALYVLKALQSGKNVFVEKPLCMDAVDLEEIRLIAEKTDARIMTGFNRRFAPLVTELVKELPGKEIPIAINFRINAGALAPGHWVNDMKTGGGRILGEACHFIDLAIYLAKAKVNSVSATEMNVAGSMHDTAVITMLFDNGSIANISYFSNGNNTVEKERLEIFYSGQVALIDDFRSLKITGRKQKEIRSGRQDKGHASEMAAFIESVRKGIPSPLSFEEQYHSMMTTFCVMESIAAGGERISIPVTVSNTGTR